MIQTNKDSLTASHSTIPMKPATKDSLSLTDGTLLQRGQSFFDKFGENAKRSLTDTTNARQLFYIEQKNFAGELQPYQVKHDSGVTATLMIGAFVIIFLLARNLSPFLFQLHNLMLQRDRKDTIAAKSEGELGGRGGVTAVSGMALSVLFFVCLQQDKLHVFTAREAYLLLAANFMVLTLYHLYKYAVYAYCNWTFFAKEQRAERAVTYRVMQYMRALSYFALAVLAVYYGLSPKWVLIVLFFVFATTAMIGIIRAQTIFFHSKLACFYNFLYFCTLETMPLPILWLVLTEIVGIKALLV